MPINGHPPVPRPFALNVCTSCRTGNHQQCGPIWDRARHRVLYCECPGWAELTPTPTHLPCLLGRTTR